MIELNLTAPVIPTIKYMGHEFAVQMGELDIIDLLEQAKDRAMNLKDKPSIDDILGYLRHINEAIDNILGEGAMAKLAAGRSVNAATAMRWLRDVAGDALKANMEACKAKND